MPPESMPLESLRTCPAKRRRGFTLVEMLVVIVIITALAALLVPAVMISIKSARQARIALEVANLAKALERYKMEIGEYPPDFAELVLLTNVNDKASRAKQLIDAHLSSVYRRRDTSPTGDYPKNASGAVDLNLLASLSPKNALVFWLRGFTADPQYPLSANAERTSMFDFDLGRLNSVTGEYHPSGDSTKQPYIYYNAQSYVPNQPIPPGGASNFNPTGLPAVAWAMGTSGTVCPPYRASNNQGSPQGPFAQHDKFQVISAGLDGEFGSLLDFEITATWAQISNYPEVPSGNAIHKPHRDNLTSFTEGPIDDILED